MLQRSPKDLQRSILELCLSLHNNLIEPPFDSLSKGGSFLMHGVIDKLTNELIMRVFVTGCRSAVGELWKSCQ